MACRSARSVGLMAVVMLGSALLEPAAAARPKRSEAYRRLNLEYYRLTDSLEHPDKWREAVAQRKAYIAKVQDTLRRKPERRATSREPRARERTLGARSSQLVARRS